MYKIVVFEDRDRIKNTEGFISRGAFETEDGKYHNDMYALFGIYVFGKVGDEYQCHLTNQMEHKTSEVTGGLDA